VVDGQKAVVDDVVGLLGGQVAGVVVGVELLL
jgi:hypothetical protein